jgi:glycine/D-amino acid oxidase-like deaminating enzyme
VVLLDGRRCGWAASGRNGGFCEPSLTHGLANGVARFPGEIHRLEELAAENFAGLRADLARLGIDAQLEMVPILTAATRPHEVGELAGQADLARSFGRPVRLLDAAGARALVDSPSYLGGLLDESPAALVHPARLALGLRAAVLAAGVRVHEASPVTGLRAEPGGVALRTPTGTVRARRVVLATGALNPLLPVLRRRLLPVFDYALVTEPLPPEARRSLGWAGRHGVTDAGNRFHYYRLTRDDRVLWGGYDAVYHFGNRSAERLARRPRTFARLARQFAATFPQLAGVRFEYAWGGVVDTCTRFSVFFGTACGGRLGYAAGYTGLGVAASRFGARVALDLLHGGSELTRLDFVRSRPRPMPPEPLRSLGVAATQLALARADATGRRGAWLRLLDRAGMGFDS